MVGCVGVIIVSLVNIEVESFIFLGEEVDIFYDGGLYDFFVGEDILGYSVRIIVGCVGVEVIIFGYSIVCEVGVVFEVMDYFGEDVGMD